MIKKLKNHFTWAVCLGVCMSLIWAGASIVKSEGAEAGTSDIPNVSNQLISSQNGTVSAGELTFEPTQMPTATPTPTPTSTPMPTATLGTDYKVVLDKTQISVKIGKTEPLKAQVKPQNDNAIISWFSMDESIAKVSTDGVVTGVKKGSTKIIAKFNEKEATCFVTVVENPVTDITLDKRNIYITGDGQISLAANITPKDADDKRVLWYSSNEMIAEVDSYGVVKGYADGTCEVYAKSYDGGYVDFCIVHVSNASVKYISMDRTQCELMVGEVQKRIVMIAPSTARKKILFWTSSDSSIAKVDEQGNIMAVNVGTATITATSFDGEKTASCKVIVSEAKATSLSLDKKKETVIIGKPIKLKGNILPNFIANKTLLWKSNKPSIATVDSYGNICGNSYGKAKITASINGLSSSCEVTVVGEYGNVKYDDGGYYEGELGNQKRNGIGTYTQADGTAIEGTWSNDKLISKIATVTLKNGDEYVGCYKNYVKSGKGTYTKNAGTIIKGKWIGNKLSGKVTIEYMSGDKYIGNIKNNKKNGKGTYYFANGDKYIGKWKNDKMNGAGKYILCNGAYYKGTFKDNKLTGVGFYKEYKGKLNKGIFKNVKVKTIDIPIMN